MRIESFATASGELVVYAAAAMPLAQELGARLEQEFDIAEAVVLRQKPPK